MSAPVTLDNTSDVDATAPPPAAAAAISSPFETPPATAVGRTSGEFNPVEHSWILVPDDPGSPSASGAAPAAAPGVVGTWALDYVAKPTTMSTSSSFDVDSTGPAGDAATAAAAAKTTSASAPAPALSTSFVAEAEEVAALASSEILAAPALPEMPPEHGMVGWSASQFGWSASAASSLAGSACAEEEEPPRAHRVSAAVAAAAEGLAGAGGTIMCHLDVVGAVTQKRWAMARKAAVAWRRPLVVAAVLIASHGLAVLIGVYVGRRCDSAIVVDRYAAAWERRFSSGVPSHLHEVTHAVAPRLCLPP